MGAHTPKLRALLALQENALSPEGRARLDRHLTGCATCRAMQTTLGTYEAVRMAESTQVAAWLAAKPPLVLERTATAAKPRAGQREAASIRPMLGAFVAAAAALALTVLATPENVEPDASLETGLQPPQGWTVPIGRATAISGQLMRWGPTGPTALALGARVEPGDTMYTDAESSAHVEFPAAGVAWSLAPDSEVSVGVASGGTGQRLVLTLRRGTIISELLQDRAPEHWELAIRAEEWTVEVTGTLFGVTAAGGVGVFVERGAVTVSRHGRTVLELPAGQSFGVAAPVDLLPPYRLGRGAGRPASVTLSDVRVDHWAIDSQRIEADSGSLHVHVHPGRHRIAGFRSDQVIVEDWFEVDRNLRWNPGATTAPRSRPEERFGHLTPEQIRPVMQTGMPGLQRCYQRAGRRGDEVGGRFGLRITVSRSGRVGSAHLRDSQGSATPAFRRCVEQAAQAWTFPAPIGGPVTFEQPLRFTARLP